ncbi:MAG: hypothetical protein AB7Q97_04585 [Gammaproteobacteria bacterium]
MKRSVDEILTTHTGSLPREPKLLSLLLARSRDEPFDRGEFEATVREQVAATVARQIAAGLTVVNDGEQSKISYAGYLKDRLAGFELRPIPSQRAMERAEVMQYPEFYARAGRVTQDQGPIKLVGCCTGELAWKDFSEVERDIANLKAATAGATVGDVFMTAPSPSIASGFQHNVHYANDDDYRMAIAGVMKREYEAIAAAGFVLQIDCPDLTVGYRLRPPGLTMQEFRRQIARQIEILNFATRDIDPEQMRIHVCWGADEGPHTEDPPLEAIVDILLTARPAGMTIVGANGRHEHEWAVWKNVKVPDGKVILPGVIDSTTNIIEHPQTVAERIVRYANVLGRENIIAGVDCGFDTLADFGQVDPKVAWAKLGSLAEGARIATRALRPR